MDTFSSDNSRIMPVGITSQVVRGVQRNPILQIPIQQLTKKQQQIKDISESLLRILDKLSSIK